MRVCNKQGLVNCAAHGELYGEQLQRAFRTLQVLQEKRIPVSRDILYAILQECIKHKHLSAGKKVHSLLVYRGLDSAACFGDHLIRLFASCGSLPEATHVFESVTCPRTHTWNAIISAHANLGQNERSLHLYKRMLQSRNPAVDGATLSCVLKACSALGAIEQGRIAHGHILEEVLDCDVIVMNTLVDMYAKNSSMEDARYVFDGLPNRNVISWGTIICGYSEQGYGGCALELFAKMQVEGLDPSKAIFLAVLKACGSSEDVSQGRQIHDRVLRSADGSDLTIESALVDMYAKCGSLDEAYAVFEGIQNVDVAAWGAMIAGYADNGRGYQALEAYKKMQKTNVKPNTAVFLSLLKACSSISKLEHGMLLHEEIIKAELDLDLMIRAALIDMYSRCGSIEKAQKVFDESLDPDSVVWSAIIVAWIQHGHKDCAVEYFEHMIVEDIQPKTEAYISLLKSSTNGSSCIGWRIHDQIVRGKQEQGVVLGSALIDMYSRFGCVEEARCVFDRLYTRNVISWGGMIAGYVQQELELDALALFNMMLEDGVNPDKATLSCIVKACRGAGAIIQGRNTHDLIIRNNFDSDAIVSSSLVDMYANCGSLVEACKVFDAATCQDVVLWGGIIAGCCLHGNLNLATKYLISMKERGLKPMNVIFTSMLAACCHSGRLEEGHQVFSSMREDLDIVPDEEHYSCMVDLFSRGGSLNDAQILLQSVPYQPDIIMGTSFLTGCKTYCNMEMGSRCFEKVF